MKLTVIGCSGSMSGPASPASAYLVQATGLDGELERTWSIALDFGPGAMGQLLNYVDPAMLDGIFFSHLHADHCADIVGMQVYRRWYPEGPLRQIPVFGPGDMLARTRGISADDESETYETEFDFQRICAGSVIQLGPFTINAFAAWHTVEALSLRVTGPSEDGENTVVLTYTGDTDYAPTVVDAAREADILLSEAAFEYGRDAVEGVHMNGVQAGQLATEANAKRLLLTHLQPWTNPARNEKDARSAYDGDVHAVSAGEHFAI